VVDEVLPLADITTAVQRATRSNRTGKVALSPLLL
jgi:hypothetical protein